MLPSFIIVGAEKCGTTTLASILSNHPEVYMSKPKEPRFFTRHNWEKGIKWYENLFKDSEGFKVVGEASPAYTWYPLTSETPKRIYETLGDIKYIYIIRDPVQRTISHINHAFYHDWVKEGSSIENTLKSIPGLLNCSKYHYQVKPYLKYTDIKQWCIVTLEDLVNDHNAVLTQIYDFLGVKAVELESLPIMNSTNDRFKNPEWVKYFDILKPVFKPVLKPVLSDGLKEQIANYTVKLGIKRAVEKPYISYEIKKYILGEVIDDVRKLSELLDRDFVSFWNINKLEK